MAPVDDWVDVGQPVPIQAQTQSPILSAPSDDWVDTSKPTRVPFTYMPAKPEDFKYTPPSAPPTPKPSTARNVISLVNPADNMLGFAKGAAGTAYQIYKGVANAVQGKPAETIRDPNIESALQTQTWGEQAGKLEENAGEYMAGEGALTGAARAAIGATKVPRVLSVVGRAAAGATSAAAVQKAQGGSNTDTAIAAVGGGVLGPLIEGTAAGAKWLGLKFQARAVGLSAKDVARGASRASEAPLAMIDRLNTYGVARPTLGGTLDATQQKITSLANDLRTQLRASNAGEAIQPSAQGAAANVFDASTRVTTQPALPGAGVSGGATVANTAAQRAAGAAAHRAEVIEAIKAGREIPEDVAQQYPDLANAIHLSKIPGPKVDLASAVDRAEAAIAVNATHMTPVEMQQAKAAIAQYRAHYAAFEHGAIVPLDDAQNAKRAAGLAGAWEYGKQAGDKGMERVSNLIFGYLRDDIDAAATTAGVNVQTINKQLSDLIPLEQAMVRRVPVEARQQVLTLTDWMLVATGHPVEAAARVGGKMFGMGVGAGLVKGASGMRTASRPLTASVLDILNAKNAYQKQHSALANIVRGNPLGEQQ